MLAEARSKPLSSTLQMPIEVFYELSARRGYGLSGPMPITFEAIMAYMNVRAIRLNQFVVDCILLLDVLFLKHSYEAGAAS